MSVLERIRRMIFPGSSRERDADVTRLQAVEARHRTLVPRMDALAADIRPNGPIVREVRHAERVVATLGDRRHRSLPHYPERRAR